MWALCVGFFMILVDATIVSVATPALMRGLHTDVNSVVWVTSAYLLSYAVPLLITGRLGDRFGPKNIYLLGLVLFTGSSLWCGFTGDIRQLIAARVVQGLGASLMAPQTMAVVTRIFPATSRGQAMGMWGAVAGVAMLVGPIVGGVLVDALGWEWIFFINVPIGVIAFALAWRLVPALPTHEHRFDVVGVALSAAGMFLLVFGIQEGQDYHWSGLIWTLIAVGVVVLGGFVYWQRRNTGEPLIPLTLFRDRNFSLANVAMVSIGFAITAIGFPLMLYAQKVRGLSPTRAALLLIPMAVLTSALAPFIGRLADRVHPRYVTGVGLIAFPASLVWLALVMRPGAAIWALLLPIGLLGVANGFMWAPLSPTATRNLPLHLAGAGSGVYNTARQIGAVLGSAGIAVIMQARIGASLPSGSGDIAERAQVLPVALRHGYSIAMSQSMLLPAAVIIVALVAALCFAAPAHLRQETPKAAEAQPLPVES
jgi:EmrB/QacA subfamily drug resistance transporter